MLSDNWEKFCKPKVAKLTLESEDTPVINFDVTEPGFGASGDGVTDNTAVIQRALDAAGRAGGGVVFIPVGRYKINSHLVIPVNVTLRGDWKSPEEGGLGKGTILMAYEGRGDEDEIPFIQTEDGATIKGVTIWYPEQNDIKNVVPYPWTIQNGSSRSGYYGPNIINVTLINSYLGVKIDGGNNCHYIKNLYGTILKKGLHIDWVLDIGREQTVWLRPKYWASSGLGNPPSENQILESMRDNAVGITLYKSDWEYLYDIFLEGFYIGLLADESHQGYYNGQIWGLHTEGGRIGVYCKKVSDIGISISRSIINTTGEDSFSILTGDNFVYPQCVFFNTCAIGTEGTGAEVKNGGILSFVHCKFTKWGKDYAIKAHKGSLCVEGNRFLEDKPHINLGEHLNSAVIFGNSFLNNAPKIINNSCGEIKIDNTRMTPDDFPQMPVQGPSLGRYRKPCCTNLFYVMDFGAKGDEVADDTDAFQAALEAAKGAGGGTVYVPAGRFKITGHLRVYSNVELRGCSDGPHHYALKSRGTVLIAIEGKNNPGGNSFITLDSKAGLRGLSIFYPEQWHDKNISYPPTVLCSGTGAYVIDTTFPDSYDAIKITAGDYYIDYARGMGVNSFIHVEGVTEPGYLVNVQNTVGDWQDGPKNKEMLIGFSREKNAPPEDWWLSAPCCCAEGIKLENTSNAKLFNNFTFGIGYGLVITGSSSDIDIYGQGVDNAEHAVALKGSGDNINFINTELVSIGGENKRYIFVPEKASVSASFFNTLAWACVYGIEFRGTGKLTIQQYNNLLVGDLEGGYIKQLDGGLWIDSSYIHTNSDHVYIDSNSKQSNLYGNIGHATGFRISADEKEPDAWMNIKS